MEPTNQFQQPFGRLPANDVAVFKFIATVMESIPSWRSPEGYLMTTTIDGWEFNLRSCQALLYVASVYIQKLPNGVGDPRVGMIDIFLHARYGRTAIEALRAHFQQFNYPMPPPTLSVYRVVQFTTALAIAALRVIPDADGARALEYVLERHLNLGLNTNVTRAPPNEIQDIRSMIGQALNAWRYTSM